VGLPVILQVVGYQNSGKTTLITTLLQRLAEKGLKTGVIKHHGHPEPLMLNDDGKDTERHRGAGAEVTCVTSSFSSVLSMNAELTLKQSIRIYQALNLDCVLIEGYKKVQYPRVVLLRNHEDDTQLLSQTENLIACIKDTHPDQTKTGSHFYWVEKEKWTEYLITYLVKRIEEERMDLETI
jgi:molybdopterin-guanine dinucleotide biosynthesis adapter protein